MMEEIQSFCMTLPDAVRVLWTMLTTRSRARGYQRAKRASGWKIARCHNLMC